MHESGSGTKSPSGRKRGYFRFWGRTGRAAGSVRAKIFVRPAASSVVLSTDDTEGAWARQPDHQVPSDRKTESPR
jgi:hypothetical protein